MGMWGWEQGAAPQPRPGPPTPGRAAVLGLALRPLGRPCRGADCCCASGRRDLPFCRVFILCGRVPPPRAGELRSAQAVKPAAMGALGGLGGSQRPSAQRERMPALGAEEPQMLRRRPGPRTPAVHRGPWLRPPGPLPLPPSEGLGGSAAAEVHWRQGLDSLRATHAQPPKPRVGRARWKGLRRVWPGARSK